MKRKLSTALVGPVLLSSCVGISAICSSAAEAAVLYDFSFTAGSISALGSLEYDGPFGTFSGDSVLNDNATWNISFFGRDQDTGENLGFQMQSGSTEWEFDRVGNDIGEGNSFFRATPTRLTFFADEFTNLVGKPSSTTGSIAGASDVDFSFFGGASPGFELFDRDNGVSTGRQPLSEFRPSGDVPEPLTILGSVTVLGVGALLKKEHSRRLKKTTSKA